jgi:transposase
MIVLEEGKTMAYIQLINLKRDEKLELSHMVKRGRWSRFEIKRAEILLLADSNKAISNSDIATYLKCGRETARRIRERYITEGLKSAIFDRVRSGQPKKLSEKEEAYIVATACSKVPAGRDHWTLEMIRDKVNRKRKDNPISTKPIIRVFLQNQLKPWREKNVGDSRSHLRV